jgi:AraC-like DNA-binding protein
MKPRLEQLAHLTRERSFICYEIRVPAFEFLWHYHPEYELTLISKGSGTRLVGDSYHKFQDGDLVLLPPSLPHTWISETNSNEYCQAIVIQFSKTFVDQLLGFSELSSISKLFEKSARGLAFHYPKNNDLIQLLQKMIQSNEVVGFSKFIQVLDLLVSKKSTAISSLHYKPLKGNENQQRINQVFQYVQNNFKETVSLEQAASMIHLSVSAFCKFFKRTSGKTFSDYTNEIRIPYACQMLIETDLSISEIAATSGFDSMSYFNRVFLKKKNIQPAQFRKL